MRVLSIALALVCAACETEPSRAKETAPGSAPALVKLAMSPGPLPRSDELSRRACVPRCPDGVQRTGTITCGSEREGIIACAPDGASILDIGMDSKCETSWVVTTSCPVLELRAARACREECVRDGVRGQRIGAFACGADLDGSIACPTRYRGLEVTAPQRSCLAGWQPQTRCQYPRAPLCNAPPGQCCIEQHGVTEIVTPTGAMGNTLCGPDWDGWCRSICICLARATRIDTPSGEVAITELRAGMTVYSRDRNGFRIAVPVLFTHETRVPADHRVIHLVLADGRTVDVSPGHPDASGRRVGELAPDDAFDGTTIASAAAIAYSGGSTFDLLPASETGMYWANGIPLGSTLR